MLQRHIADRSYYPKQPVPSSVTDNPPTDSLNQQRQSRINSQPAVQQKGPPFELLAGLATEQPSAP
jgi:hypothetical protein